MKKCNNCGNMSVELSAIACPDCGDENNLTIIQDEAVDMTGSTSLSAPNNSDADQPEVSMPSIDMSMDQGPVVTTITLPDKTTRELREGDTLSIANDRYKEDVDVRLPDDDQHAGVSGTEPFLINVSGGKVMVTGGGGNGFRVVTSRHYKADHSVEVDGGSSLVLGRSTVLKVS